MNAKKWTGSRVNPGLDRKPKGKVWTHKNKHPEQQTGWYRETRDNQNKRIG